MSNQSRTGFGQDTTTDEVLEGIDLSGRLALVTGGSGGLGEETARALASKGARIILTARDAEKGAAAAERIRSATGSAAVEVESLELGSFESIRAFADRILARDEPIHLLVNNAGVMACPFSKTDEGLELQFGANHVGHFLMTCLIAPALLRGAPARIVNLSSLGHTRAPVDFDDIQFERRPYEKWEAYGQAKTANVLFTVELERRLGDRGVHAYAVHPGVIPTDLARHLEQQDFEEMAARVRSRKKRSKLKSIPEGAATSVYAATAPELEGRGGLYLEDCHVAAVDDDELAGQGVRSYAVDPENARRLWAVSEEIVGQAFDL